MAPRTRDAWAKRAGLAIGLVLALAAILSWRIPAEGAGPGADARFVAVPPGELTLSPAGAFLSARRLEPGGRAARGRLAVSNVSGRPVVVRLRFLPSSRDLDRALHVRIESEGSVAFGGTLGRLRGWTPVARLARGEARTLQVRAWLASKAEGSAVDVTVEARADG
jgi:hypothetical protein